MGSSTKQSYVKSLDKYTTAVYVGYVPSSNANIAANAFNELCLLIFHHLLILAESSNSTRSIPQALALWP